MKITSHKQNGHLHICSHWRSAEGNGYTLKSTVPYIPMRTNILQRSLIHFSVYFFVSSWYALVCTVKFNIFEIKYNFEKCWEWAWGGGLPPRIMKFKNTYILTESKTFYPHKNCRTYVNKTIFARQWRQSLCNNHYGPLYFLLVPISFRCPTLTTTAGTLA